MWSLADRKKLQKAHRSFKKSKKGHHKKPAPKLTYKQYILSSAWKYKRLRILKRADNKCEKCGYSGRLQVHHLTYKHLFHEPLKDLIALCPDCHKDIHGLLTEEEIEIRVNRMMGL